MTDTPINTITRRAALGLLALPAACSLQPLAPLRRQGMAPPSNQPAMRPPAMGQRWRYRVLNVYNGETIDTVQEEVSTLAPITIRRQSAQHGEWPAEIHTEWGRLHQDPLWDTVQSYDTALPLWPAVLTPGNTLSMDTHYRPGQASYTLWISLHSHVTGWERLTLDAGTFETVRIDRLFRLQHSDSSRQNFTRTDTLWLAPAIGRWVARETNGEYWTSGRRPTQYREDHLRWELESWA